MANKTSGYAPTMKLGWRVGVIGLLAACAQQNPAATCTDGVCSDPRFPYCDADGAVTGEPGSCVAVSCTPGAIKECRGDMAFTCRSDGAGYELQACDLGCSDSPSAHCKYLQPKYAPDICDVPASLASLSLSGRGTIDPNVDTTCSGGVIPQPGADLCVVRAKNITVAANSSLKIAGSAAMNGRAIAFVADDQLTISGSIDLSGHVGVNGPGGGIFVSGGAPTLDTQTGITTAGGGAGGATAGAAGATGHAGTGADAGGANGGPQAMNPALLTSFVGGASTVRPLDVSTGPDPYFGGGGGALMLVSCHGTVSIDGQINAGGGGGAGGLSLLLPVPGRGGGAGGNILVQGRDVTITGRVFANGGAGGQGWFASTPGGNGQDGSASDTDGAIGGNLVGGAGEGGAGGWIELPPSGGKHPTDSTSGPGGGGGSVGFLQTYTPAGTDAMIAPAHASPAFQPNGTVETR